MDFTEEEEKVLSELDDTFRKERAKKKPWMSINPFILWIVIFIVVVFLYGSKLITYENSSLLFYFLYFIIFSMILDHIKFSNKLKISLRLIKKLMEEVNRLRHNT